jgi:hypothetical protein
MSQKTEPFITSAVKLSNSKHNTVSLEKDHVYKTRVLHEVPQIIKQ